MRFIPDLQAAASPAAPRSHALRGDGQPRRSASHSTPTQHAERARAPCPRGAWARGCPGLDCFASDTALLHRNPSQTAARRACESAVPTQSVGTRLPRAGLFCLRHRPSASESLADGGCVPASDSVRLQMVGHALLVKAQPVGHRRLAILLPVGRDRRVHAVASARPRQSRRSRHRRRPASPGSSVRSRPWRCMPRSHAQRLPVRCGVHPRDTPRAAMRGCCARWPAWAGAECASR